MAVNCVSSDSGYELAVVLHSFEENSNLMCSRVALFESICLNKV